MLSGLLGFFLSWQYGSCYSWIAQKLDITGRVAPVFFIGCGAGGFVFPPISGAVFTWQSWGPVGILHLTLAVCLAQCGLFAAMYAVSRRRRVAAQSSENAAIDYELNLAKN